MALVHFGCVEGRFLAIVLHPRPATHLTGRVAFLSWLCACVLVQVIRSGGARLGQLPPSMAGVAMPLGACAATLLAHHLACECLTGLFLRLLRLRPF